MINNEPETCLYEEQTVLKSHPQILFRGELDNLYAETLYVCVYAKDNNIGEIYRQLAHFVHVIKKMMSIEALKTQIKVDDLIEMDAKWLRTVSQDPKKHIGIDHFLPDENDDMIIVLLNKLRTSIRSCERVCICAGIDYGANECLQMSLNRLSSAIYIIMLKHKLKSNK